MNSYRRQKPRWVIVRENEEARAAARRDENKSPAIVIRARVLGSTLYAETLATIEQAINAFYSTGTDEELVASLRAEGGRSAIRRRIIKESGTAIAFQSEMVNPIPVSAFIDHELVQNMEARALSARQGAASHEQAVRA